MRSTAARLALPAAVAILVAIAIVAAVPSPAPAQESENTTTTFGFDLQADGDARVSITVRLALEDDAERRAFERMAEDHESGADSPLSIGDVERSAALASEATGRPMAIQDVSRTADRTNRTGRLVLSATWTNFTRIADGELVVGDAFRRPGGTWLPGLDAGQELRITFPDGYSPESISMPGTRYQLVNGIIYVEGPATFEPGTPTVVLQQPGGGTTPPPTPERTPITGPIAVAAVLLAVVGLAALGYRFRDRVPERGGPPVGDADVDHGEPAATDPEPDPMSEPLLSDEERVLKLLESRDGRMKQVEIVEATDWSNAKVSQLLSEMEEAGRVDKLRIGRENLISLPGRGPGGE